MSAIAGIYHTNNEPVHIEHSNAIMKNLEQYPADDIQTWYKKNIFLGCHAQWVTPESVGELLPYYDKDRKLSITADAIIDNRDELFEKLQVDYYKRRSISDSELILLAYHKWKEESPKYLVGDFAFLIWDDVNQKLFGARDFSGSRTLYYYRGKQRFAFCTTIQPLLSLPYVEKQLNEQWLAQYLAITGMIDVVDASATPYNNIKQIPPSHSISIVGEKVALNRYCTLSSEKKLKFKSDEEYVEAFQEVFQEAVSSRLRTYRHVGAQLSGGLDSGSIVGFASKELSLSNKTLHTFSYIPPSDFIDFTPRHLMPDERPLIKSTVNYVGGINDHYLDFDGRDSYSEIEGFLEMMEMPYKFFENSFWLKGMFEKANNEGVGILLNGGRGNLSISWGSALDFYALLLKRLKWVRLYQELDQYSKNVGGARLRRLPSLAKKAFPTIKRAVPAITSNTNSMLINVEFARKTNVYTELSKFGIDESGWFSSTNIYEQRIRHFADVFHWNASNTLSTKLSLRHGLWKRDPTNDIRVIRFCLSVPESQYVQKGLDRALIRRSTKGLLPDNVRLNQRIHGVQGADWVHRMIPHWDTFIEDVQQMANDKDYLIYLNGQAIKDAFIKVKDGVSPSYVVESNSKVLMRSLIVYKFLKRFD
ncbi:lasso peptide isopeptide bond-forming cyclase [Halalkalibacter alkalisediminis]|uniref:asparagine synthase (glutamine-hydrolyzing) n=1 Tax=Halalkalibacter alkalisediminis TaxID=935616 RepID=A0ABV6NHB7_9BACI|nr:lasso peptide isopeptide bond-forming cyclase [Halalkalibacter alkalisediminis]